MKNSLDYLNSTMRRGRFYLVEVIQLAGAELTAHAAQVVAAPARGNAARSTSEGVRKEVEEAEYLSNIDDPAYRDAVHSIIARCEALGIEVKWRSKGAALRIDTPDRRQPLAIGWMLPEGSHWQAARYVTLGVDPTSLAQTPSVSSAVLAYAQQVKSISGGTAPKSSLNAATFTPAILPGVLPEVDAALTCTSGTARGVTDSHPSVCHNQRHPGRFTGHLRTGHRKHPPPPPAARSPPLPGT